MKGIWAGGMSLALGWYAAGAAAEDVAAARRPVAEVVGAPRPALVAQGVSLGRPKPIAVGARVTAPPSGVVQASHTVPAVTTLPPVDPTPSVFPEDVGSMRSLDAALREQPYLTPFASDNRQFGKPIVLASTAAPAAPIVTPSQAPVGVTRYLPNARLAPVPAEEEPAPTSFLSKYVASLRQTLAPAGESFSPAADSAKAFAESEADLGWPYRFYGGAEYLLWWTKGAGLPPLVTTGPPQSLGIIGQPGTVVLFGGNRSDPDVQSGGRFTLGWWCDPCQLTGIEANYFFLGRRSARFIVGSDSTPLIARPFFSANDSRELAEVATFPGEVSGRVAVDLPTRLWGGQLNLRRNLCRTCSYSLDLLVGLRYVELEEGLIVVEDLTTLPTATAVPPGTRALVIDRFDTRNQFYGGQLGAAAEFRRGPWFLDVRGTVALGNTHQEIAISGTQAVTNAAGRTTPFQGGLLALSTNSGQFSRDRFGVVPELGVNVGYQFGPQLRAFVGYNFLYWSNVLRPGDQIDRVLDTQQIPNFQTSGMGAGLTRPLVPFRGTDFWAQGVSVGVEFRY